MNTKRIGDWAEKQALKYLKKQGLKVVVCNYCCYFGEIDIIMRDREALVFVEVRYRHSTLYGRPEETVDRRKQLKIQKTALHFLQMHPQYNQASMRFDVIAMTDSDKGCKTVWLKDAFVCET